MRRDRIGCMERDNAYEDRAIRIRMRHFIYVIGWVQRAPKKHCAMTIICKTLKKDAKNPKNCNQQRGRHFIPATKKRIFKIEKEAAHARWAKTANTKRKCHTVFEFFFVVFGPGNVTERSECVLFLHAEYRMSFWRWKRKNGQNTETRKCLARKQALARTHRVHAGNGYVWHGCPVYSDAYVEIKKQSSHLPPQSSSITKATTKQQEQPNDKGDFLSLYFEGFLSFHIILLRSAFIFMSEQGKCIPSTAG